MTLFRKETYKDHLLLLNANSATRNALSADYYEGVLDGLAEAANDPDIAAVILAGQGGFFCSGGDLNQLVQRRDMTVEQRYDSINRLHDIIRAIRTCPKPVISAVEGGAAGAGLSIAFACDMVVAAQKAKFVLAYVRAGLVPDGGVTHTLMQMLPRATVSRMAMLAEPMSAEALHQMGAITELVTPGEAIAFAQGLAADLAKGPTGAIATIKSLLHEAQTASLDDQLEAECRAMAQALGSAEAQIGISAFLNKQNPVFR